MRARLLGLALAGAVALGVASPAVSEVRLTLPEARGTAVQFLMQGRPDVALVLAEGVLLGAPGDVDALLLKSRALRDMGRPAEASEAARDALDSASNDRDRYFSSMALAQAKSADNRGLQAKYWLRRAVDFAPDDTLRATAIHDFQLVRRMTPSRLRLSFSLNPADNLNDAPRGERLCLWPNAPFCKDLAKPLSGIELKTRVDYTRRFALSRVSRTNLGLFYQGQRARLSSEARRRDPGAENGDFAVDVIGASFGYEQRATDGRWLAAASVTQMHIRAAGEQFSDVTRLDLSYGRALAPNLTGTVAFGLERSIRHDESAGKDQAVSRDANTRDVGLSLSYQMASGTLKMALDASDTESESPLVAKAVKRAELGYRLARPVLGLLPSLTLSYEETVFDRALMPEGSVILPDWSVRREDAEWGLAVDATVPGWSFRGFAPEIGVSFRDRSSNYTPYDTQGAELKLGLKSVF